MEIIQGPLSLISAIDYRLIQSGIETAFLDTPITGTILLATGNTVGALINSVFGNFIQGGVNTCPQATFTSINSKYPQYCGVSRQSGTIW
jgi:hypothetical protein